MGIPDIAKEKSLNNAQIVILVIFAISSTFALTNIYNRFEYTEDAQTAFETLVIDEFNTIYQLIDTNNENQTRRLNTKTGRNEELIKKLENN